MILFLSLFLLSGISMATTYTIDDVYNDISRQLVNRSCGLVTTMAYPDIDSASITVAEGDYITQIQIIGSQFDNSIFTSTYTYWDSLFINTNETDLHNQVVLPMEQVVRCGTIGIIM